MLCRTSLSTNCCIHLGSFCSSTLSLSFDCPSTLSLPLHLLFSLPYSFPRFSLPSLFTFHSEFHLPVLCKCPHWIPKPKKHLCRSHCLTLAPLSIPPSLSLCAKSLENLLEFEFQNRNRRIEMWLHISPPYTFHTPLLSFLCFALLWPHTKVCLPPLSLSPG